MTLHFRNELLEFVGKWAKKRGGLSAALKKDLSSEPLMQHLKLLGLCGKIITGPWMTLFYTEEKANLDMCPALRKCQTFIEVRQLLSFFHFANDFFSFYSNSVIIQITINVYFFLSFIHSFILSFIYL